MVGAGEGCGRVELVLAAVGVEGVAIKRGPIDLSGGVSKAHMIPRQGEERECTVGGAAASWIGAEVGGSRRCEALMWLAPRRILAGAWWPEAFSLGPAASGLWSSAAREALAGAMVSRVSTLVRDETARGCEDARFGGKGGAGQMRRGSWRGPVVMTSTKLFRWPTRWLHASLDNLTEYGISIRRRQDSWHDNKPRSRVIQVTHDDENPEKEPRVAAALVSKRATSKKRRASHGEA